MACRLVMVATGDGSGRSGTLGAARFLPAHKHHESLYAKQAAGNNNCANEMLSLMLCLSNMSFAEKGLPSVFYICI